MDDYYKIKNNGVVFTPSNIVKYMTSYIDNNNIKKILEPSCGVGNFLENIDKKHNITCIDINKKYILEIRKKYKNVKTIIQNFIDYKTDDKYDYIIGNPPYIKIQNINKKDLYKIRNEFPDFINGNTNLYIYFIIKCLKLLNDNGKLIFIIPNTWIYSKSFLYFKNYILDNKLLELLIDFKDKQIFNNVSTYTSIIILTNKQNDFYYYSNDIDKKLIKKNYNNNNNNKNYSLLNTMTPRIGIMTLKDDVFIIKKFKILNNKIYFIKNDKEYIIEKDACKNILKVSKNKVYLIIYPYDNNCKIIEDLKNIYPLTYNYLFDFKNELDKRDNGNNNYKKWYCYGRTQSLKISNKKRLFISTIVKNIKDFLITKKVDLYYSGLCIEPKNNYDIEDIKIKLLKKEKQILQSSNNKSNNWYSLSVNSFKTN